MLAASPQPVVVRDIAEALHRDASNVRDLLHDLAAEGLIATAEPVRAPGARGRPVKLAYVLTDVGRHSLEELSAPAVGMLTDGDHVVLADARGGNLPELFQVLAAAEAVATHAWGFVVTGQGDRYAIAFRGKDASGRASDLLSSLATAKIASERVILSGFSSGDQLVADARRRAAAAGAARLVRSDIRHAG